MPVNVQVTAAELVNLHQQIATLYQQIEGIASKGVEEKTAAIRDLRALKAGSKKLENLVITDNGWEFMPPPPANGASLESVPEPVAGAVPKA